MDLDEYLAIYCEQFKFSKLNFKRECTFLRPTCLKNFRVYRYRLKSLSTIRT